ncbi:Hypothetical predicted protein [Octopus vulgaris]|uniref:Uncharacterized protein n=1 Tax=Octopus vulgaris TaxID=6645 RepID=A0AA36B3H6_OCTVU|nr:Hypothetical predicted protein [Octopus vulgaris]
MDRDIISHLPTNLDRPETINAVHIHHDLTQRDDYTKDIDHCDSLTLGSVVLQRNLIANLYTIHKDAIPGDCHLISIYRRKPYDIICGRITISVAMFRVTPSVD